jgi:hypothetical protein
VAHAAGSALSNAFACNQIKLAEKRTVAGYMHPDRYNDQQTGRRVFLHPEGLNLLHEPLCARSSSLGFFTVQASNKVPQEPLHSRCISEINL